MFRRRMLGVREPAISALSGLAPPASSVRLVVYTCVLELDRGQSGRVNSNA